MGRLPLVTSTTRGFFRRERNAGAGFAKKSCSNKGMRKVRIAAQPDAGADYQRFR